MSAVEDHQSPPTLLPPEQLARAEAIYRDVVMRTFAFESRVGHHLAFMRTFTSPSVVGLLAHTGQIEADHHRRGTDTGLFMYELIHHGLDSPTGRHIVERLNAMHHRWRISNDDYVWVLGTFCVLGIQVIDRYGWRALTDEERQATIDWYRELGTRMGIQGIPTTYDTFETRFRDYENSHLRRTAKGDRLIAVTLDIVLSPVPRPLRPAALKAAAVIVDEPARTALGLPTPGRLTTAAVKLALRARALLRRRKIDPQPWFTPGEPVSDYPNGYTIADLGPKTSTSTDAI